MYLLVFLIISYLFDLLVTLWLSNSSQLAKLLQFEDFVYGNNVFSNIVNISLNQLKLILSFRGFYYVNQANSDINDNVEHEKLIELVKASGHVTREELINLNNLEQSIHDCDKQSREYNQLKDFSSAKLMEEEIDDNHMWLLYVYHENDSEFDWTKFVKLFNKFGFRFARFRCSSDPLYCHQRRWFTSQLVFAFPRTSSEQSSSENVNKKLIYNYSLSMY